MVSRFCLRDRLVISLFAVWQKQFTMYYEVTNYSSPFALDNTKRQDAGVYLNAMIVTKVTISDL